MIDCRLFRTIRRWTYQWRKMAVEAAEREMRRWSRTTVCWLQPQSTTWTIICGFSLLHTLTLAMSLDPCSDIYDRCLAWRATYCSLIESAQHTAPVVHIVETLLSVLTRERERENVARSNAHTASTTMHARNEINARDVTL